MTTATQARPIGAAEDPTETAPRLPAAWPRLLGVCALLTGLVFVQAPGRIATDTKLDLTVDPFGFLARALHLWEPQGFLGQVQNQAYGYLFPMGPFFGVGDLLGLPAWVVQRLWWALLLSLAFVGVERLATAMRIGVPWTRLLAGVLYALSPRMLTEIGPSSVELLPVAVAPWVVLPLVRGSARGSPRRAAALSGVALFAAGGVNAVAAAVAAIPAALYLLTRSRGARTWRLAAWWVAAVALATAWWMVPLILLGRYSPPFLDWIESASVTTSVTSLAASLRGVSQWVAYLTTPVGPELPAGWQLVTVPAVILHTMVVAAVGITGLALPRLRERLWLVSGLVVGLVLVTMGHVGPVDGGLADQVRAVLDGALAALRNTHKFDLVLRLPLALGAAHAVASAADALGRRDGGGHRVVPVVVRASVAGLLAVVVVGATAPVLTGRLVPRGSYEAIPGYWQDVSGWLDGHQDGRAALVVPGASFGTYLWGRTRDEPLQPLLDGRWAVRDAVPLTPAGTIRALDAVQRRLVSGDGSAGLTAMLARMGIGYLVVRNDLDPDESGAPRPVVVHAALDASPGLARVATFGPEVGAGSTPDMRVDDDLDRAYPAVEVWAVRDAQPPASVVPESDVLTVVGGPESLLDLGDRGLAAGRPVVLAGDRTGVPTGGTVVTDGMRRREVNFGTVDRNASFTLAPTDPIRRPVPARDYLPFDDLETVARWFGVESVTASSSAADADAPTAVEPAHQPFAAVDGDRTTSWWSGGTDGAVGQWLELRFRQPVDVSRARLTVTSDAWGTTPSRVSVTTDSGSVVRVVRPDRSRPLRLSSTPTSRLRVTLLETSSPEPGRSFAVADIRVPGITVSRTLQTPAAGASGYLTTADGATRSCVDDHGRWLCSPSLTWAGEEDQLDRVVLLDPHRSYRVAATVVPRPGRALDALLDAAWPGVRVTASSSAVADPAGRPQTVVDGDLGTGWVASPADPTPSLQIRLAEPRAVTGLRIRSGARLAASIPTTVSVRSPNGVRTGTVAEDGTVTFPRLVAGRLTVRFTTVHPVQSFDRDRRAWQVLPVGLSELDVEGAADLLRPDPQRADISLPCGAGPQLEVGDRSLPLSVTASDDEVLSGQPLAARLCSPWIPATGGGVVRVRMAPGSTWLPRSVDLVGGVDVSAGTPRSVTPTVVVWQATHRELDVPARSEPSLLVVRENSNPGWVATYEGSTLQSVVVDGWQQGWRLPAGDAGSVRLDYAPDAGYRWALVGGALAVVVLGLLALLPGRSEGGSVVAGRWPPLLLVGLGVGSLWLLAGSAGLVAGAAGVLLTRWLPRRLVVPLAWAAGASVVAAGALLAAGPWTSLEYAGNDAAPQLLCLAAVAVVVGLGVREAGPARSHGDA